MHVATEGESAFLEYLATNLLFWRNQTPVDCYRGKDFIVVDLYHDDSEYIRLNLLIAKYLQRRFGGTILGVTQDSPQARSIIRFQNWQNLQRVAYSFGVDEILTVNIDEERCLSRKNDFFSNALIKGKEGIQKALLNYISPAGLPLGMYAYENYLRSQMVETVTRCDDDLVYSINEAFALEEFFAKLFREKKCSWVVSGHMDYNFWAIMCHMALLASVPVAYSHPLTPELYVFKDAPTHAKPVQILCRFADTQVFNEILWPQREKLRQVTESLSRGARLGFKTPNWWLRPSSSSIDKSHLCAAVRNRFGWRDLNKPIVSICSHAFSDAPLSDINAHEDYFTWIVETIAFAKDDSTKYWLFKRHPHDHVYNRTDASGSLYHVLTGIDHIRAVGDELTREELFAVTDLAVTVRGSLGYDMPAQGIPCLLAGHSSYSELGFCSVADSRELYKSKLQNADKLLVMEEETKFRAQLYFALNQLFGGLNSVHILGRDIRNGAVAYWNDLRRSVELYSIEQDPLYRDIYDSLATHSPRVLNFELIRFLVSGAESAARGELLLDGLTPH
jgi:hypothetical protein